jgi:nitrite reductase (NAD(P)H)
MNICPDHWSPFLQKKLEVPPSEFIIGAKKSDEDDGRDLDDDAQICSCHVSLDCLGAYFKWSSRHRQNVLKGDIGACIKDGVTELSDIKKKTKAGSGCGGCVPLLTNIFKAEMKKAGHAFNNE